MSIASRDWRGVGQSADLIIGSMYWTDSMGGNRSQSENAAGLTLPWVWKRDGKIAGDLGLLELGLRWENGI
jgi:hypothetical protein